MNPGIEMMAIPPGVQRLRGRIDLEHHTIELVILDLGDQLPGPQHAVCSLRTRQGIAMLVELIGVFSLVVIADGAVVPVHDALVGYVLKVKRILAVVEEVLPGEVELVHQAMECRVVLQRGMSQRLEPFLGGRFGVGSASIQDQSSGTVPQNGAASRCPPSCAMPTAAPIEAVRMTPSTIALEVSLPIQRDLITPRSRAATGAVTAVVATAPARHSAAALPWRRGVSAKRSGRKLLLAQEAAIDPAERVRPRRTSRFRSLSRARTRRLETVPTGRPRIRAASWWVFPSRSQSTTGPRNEPGSWLSSSSAPTQFLEVLLRGRVGFRSCHEDPLVPPVPAVGP